LKESFFHNKVCLITGSTQGIGKELAKLVLEQGGKVCMNGRSQEKETALSELLHGYTDKAIYVAADITKKEDVEMLVSKTISHFGKLDILIANAGLSSFGSFEQTPLEVLEKVVDINLYGTMYCAHYAIPELKKSHGSILLISSVAAFHGIPDYAPYSASKMALTAFAQSLRKELFTSKVFVGIAYVGFTENDKEKRAFDTAGELQKIQDRNRFKPATRAQTATKIMRQLEHQKPVVVHSPLGKLAFYVSRLFPAISHRVFLKNYLKQQ
jgi:short-subunit dehydrogenase